MGRVSEMWLEAEARGWRDIEDKFVCIDCLYDYALAEEMAKKLVNLSCSYCGKTSKNSPIAAEMNDLMPQIVEGLALEWGDPNNEGVAYETREGGWLGEVLDTYELLDAIGFEAENPELVDDICNSLVCDQWCQRDYNRLLPQDELSFDWRNFSESLKHHSRYVFFRAARPAWMVPPERPSHEILDDLGAFSNRFNLVRQVPIGSSFFRARVHSPRKRPNDIHDLGPPPVDRAIFSNRMSPAGIPMFYGSLDSETAIQEVRQIKGGNRIIDRLKRLLALPKNVTTAEFKTVQEMWILDLTQIPESPSIFDINHQSREGGEYLSE